MKRRVTTILSLFALLILGYAEDKQEAMNSIFVISPYFKHGTWVFDTEDIVNMRCHLLCRPLGAPHFS